VNAIDSADEAKIVAAVKRAVSLVDSGMGPDDAVEKVARDDSLNPGLIRLVSHAYNTGRQTCQWQKHTGILDKLAHYPLADPEAVIGRLFPSSEKTASDRTAADVSAEYGRAPSWHEDRARVKLAHAKIPEGPKVEPYARTDRMRQLDVAYADVGRQKKAADEHRRQAVNHADAVRVKVAELADYFRKFASTRLPFAYVEGAARNFYGDAGRVLMDAVYAQARLKEKRASDGDVLTRPYDSDCHPVSLVGECVRLGQAHNRARQLQKEAEAAIDAVRKEAFLPFAEAGVARPQEKAGFFGAPAIGAAVGTMLSRGVGTMPKSKDDLVEDAWLDLEDPDHANDLRRIRTHAMLNSMLTDPDDPISGHDPEKVLQTYNEIAQMSPRLADQPAALRPVLRRRLEGNVEPFEAKELADMEKAISASKTVTPSTSLLGESPDKLLG
jgi:hypothetical protein